jgi:hypothetical protein
MGLYSDIGDGIEDAYNGAAGTLEPAFDATTPDTGPWLRGDDGNDVFQGGIFDEDPLWERTDVNETVVEHDYVQNTAGAVNDAVDEATGSRFRVIVAAILVLPVVYVLGQLFNINLGDGGATSA